MHHHWLSVFPVLSAVLLASLAMPPAPRWSDMRVMHTWNSVPANWESLGPPPAGTAIELYIALKPHHENALIDALYEVSDPRHQKYGSHLSQEQVAELVAPHQDTLEIVHSWLEHHGVPSSSISTSHGGGWLTITGMPVSQADELLSASYQIYRHTGTNETKAILRTVGYALPAALHAHKARKRSSEEAAVMVNATLGELVGVPSRRDDYVTPPFLRWLYSTQAYVPAATGQNSLGIFGFLNDYPSQVDLTRFMTNFRADAEAATFTVVPVNGGRYNPNYHGTIGADVQMQYTGAIAYPTPHIFYSTGGHSNWLADRTPAPGDGHLEWLNYLLAQPNAQIPRTISMSYFNPEQDFPRAYTKALCELFAQLGARGVSILAASGDDGVGHMSDCRDTPARRGRIKFVPVFPASCPWVTSVGGTTGDGPEVAAAFSGGGFSRHFQRPRYQYGVVLRYIRLLGTQKYKNFYSRRGRGIPDIASQAQRFAHIHDAILYESGGTVCSTSTVAGIVSLLNDHRLSSGRAPLGFLNPWLYDRYRAWGFNDITSGSNPGCNTEGFSAIAGWDPVTGLGTLDFGRLSSASNF